MPSTGNLSRNPVLCPGERHYTSCQPPTHVDSQATGSDPRDRQRVAATEHRGRQPGSSTRDGDLRDHPIVRYSDGPARRLPATGRPDSRGPRSPSRHARAGSFHRPPSRPRCCPGLSTGVGAPDRHPVDPRGSRCCRRERGSSGLGSGPHRPRSLGGSGVRGAGLLDAHGTPSVHATLMSWARELLFPLSVSTSTPFRQSRSRTGSGWQHLPWPRLP